MRMTGKASYSRRISAEEAREGYVMVLKSRLTFFPPVQRSFDLASTGLRRRTRVQSYRCTCRGPDSPHEHYFIRWKGLRRGDHVEIQKDTKKEGRYLIRIH